MLSLPVIATSLRQQLVRPIRVDALPCQLKQWEMPATPTQARAAKESTSCGEYYAECRSAIRIFHNIDPSTGLLTVSSLVPYVTWPSKAQTWNAVHVT
jgi:hypothetical protein